MPLPTNTKPADPIHLIRHTSGRAVDLRVVLEHLKLLQHRQHWRDDHVRIAIKQMRQTVINDTGSTSAPMELAERLAGHIAPPFHRHLLQAWSKAERRENRAFSPKSHQKKRPVAGPADTRVMIAKVYYFQSSYRNGEPRWYDDLSGYSHQSRQKVYVMVPREIAAVLVTGRHDDKKTPPR